MNGNSGGSAVARPVTLADVAKLAGVSVATASKAINGKEQVRAETRARVLEVAERLSFRPNVLAKSLLAGRSGTVGLLTSDLDGRFVLPILMGAEDAFGSGQVSVFLCDARGDAIRERYHLKALLDRRVDGLIVVGRQTDSRTSLGRDLPVPVVYAYAHSDDHQDRSLVPDNFGGGVMAIDHLVACGRRRIAHISGIAGHGATILRAKGAAEALAKHGLEMVGEPMFGDWSERWGRSAASMLLTQHPDIDAILCGSDQISRGAVDALRERGCDIPGAVAVMGFDNWEVLTTNSRPELTSVDLNLEALGRASAKMLFDAIDGKDIGTGVQKLPCKVVVRASTTPE